MEYRYSVVHEIFEDGRKSCGIAVVADYGECSAVIQVISDICGDEGELEQLVHKCNELHLDCIHLRDVVDDFLAAL